MNFTSEPASPPRISPMKTLLILRHAKARQNKNAEDDHERPLKKSGKKSARRMGRLLGDEKLLPTLIVSSSARRCRQTAEQLIRGANYRQDVRITGDLYAARGGALVKHLSALDAPADRLLIIGHNPGLEELLSSLLQQPIRLDPGALAEVTLAISAWREWTAETRGELAHLWEPRDLRD
jgi:phosphohistidine phosphatase